MANDDVCANLNHEHVPIYCMAHGYTYDEHEVGLMCLECNCNKQWFHRSDWSSPECDRLIEWEQQSLWHQLSMLVGRLLSGWKWSGAREMFHRAGR